MGNDRITAQMIHLRAYPDQWASDFSVVKTITALGDVTPPAAVSGLSATAKQGAILLTWDNPSLNRDGSTLRDQDRVRLYRSSAASINIDNSATFDDTTDIGWTEQYRDDVGAGITKYYKVTAFDRTRNQSLASSEVHATAGDVDPTTDIPDNASGLVFDDTIGTGGVTTGDGMIAVVFQDPATTWRNFDHYQLWYAEDSGGGYGAWTEIAHVERWGHLLQDLDTTHAFKFKAIIVATDGTPSSIADEEDNSGSGFTPNQADNSNITAVAVVAKYIIAINEVRTAHLKAGTITGDKISSTTTITAGTGNDVGVLDGADGTYRIYAGHATPASAPFRVTKAGVAYMTGAVISGTITVTGGPLLGQSGGANVLYDAGMEQASTPYWGSNGARQASGGNQSNAWWKITRAGSNVNDNALDHDGGIRYIEVNPGEIWEFGGDIKTDGACTGRILVQALDADKSNVGWATVLSRNNAAWGSESTTYTVAATVKFLKFYLQAYDSDGWAGFDNCFLRRADLEWSYIQNVSIENADIVSMTFDKITAATNTASLVIGGAGYLKSSNYSAGSAGFIVNGDGSAEFNNVTVRGTLDFAHITKQSLSVLNSELAGGITSNKITSVDAGTISAGTLTSCDIRTAASGARAQLDAGGLFEAHTFTIYDATRQRVFLGAGALILYDSGGTAQSQIVDSDSGANDYMAFFRCDSTTAGKPVLKLDQDDISEGFIDFVGSDRGAIDEGTSSVKSVRVEVNGVVGRIAIYADA